MRITTPLTLSTTAIAAAALLVLPGTATAAPASAPLLPVVSLAAERVATADLVAAAKWGTDSPIDDPAREQQVLDTAAAQAQRIGADPDEIRRVFRDQIEANKIVQRALYARWTAHPDQAPTTKPDLNVVRQTINRLNTDLVQAVADSTPERGTALCRPELAVAVTEVSHEQHADLLHTGALVRSLASLCRD